MPVTQYRKILLAICKDIRQEDVTHMKFLMKGDIGEGILENIKTSLDLITKLETLKWIGEGDLSYLVELLKSCGREDLANLIEGDEKIYAPKVSNSVKIIDLVSTHIAGDWKRLARFLGLSETKDIEVIEFDGRGVVDMATRSLNAWLKSINSMHLNKFPWELLEDALIRIPRYDIIREVKRKFPEVEERPPQASPSPPSSPEQRPPGIAQASSVVENEHPTASTPPLNFTRPDSHTPTEGTTDATITENIVELSGAQTVLSSNRGACSTDFDNHIINS